MTFRSQTFRQGLDPLNQNDISRHFNEVVLKQCIRQCWENDFTELLLADVSVA